MSKKTRRDPGHAELVHLLSPPQTLDTFHPYYRAVSNFSTNHPCYTAVFGFTFLCFFGKNVFFSNLQYYIMFYQNCPKNDFTSWNPILCHFFTKNKVVPLVFFRFLIKIHGLWILMKCEKNLRVLSCFLKKKDTKISIGKLTYWTILIKHDLVW